MKLCGNKLFKRLNTNCIWQPNTAGYWRSKKDFCDKETSEYYLLPFPVIHVVENFDIEKHYSFLQKLELVESKARKKAFKGKSRNRWDNSDNGSYEFNYKDWKWPCGYSTYLKQGLLPSRSFYKFITKEDCKNLPKY